MENKNKISREIVVYVIFGILTTLVSWATYALFVNILSMSVFWGNLLSWVCAIVFAFVPNKLLVFQSKSLAPRVVFKEISTFVLSRAVTGVIEIVCVPLLEKTGFDNIFYRMWEKISVNASLLFTDGIYSKIVLAVIVVIGNYIFSKLVIFKNKD